MSISSYTSKAYWRISERRSCTMCKKEDVEVREPGRKQRGKMDWWTDMRYCPECFDKLPEVALEF